MQKLYRRGVGNPFVKRKKQMPRVLTVFERQRKKEGGFRPGLRSAETVSAARLKDSPEARVHACFFSLLHTSGQGLLPALNRYLSFTIHTAAYTVFHP
jgi:hypothetical protein